MSTNPGAPDGAELWQVKPLLGRPRAYDSPDALLAAAIEYLNWVTATPVYATELVSYQGSSKLERVPRLRAATLIDLRGWLQISDACWRDYRFNRGEDFSRVCAWAEDRIYAQKFTGAAAGQLNPAIIARDLGLVERQEHTGRDGGPIETKELSPSEYARRIAFALRNGQREEGGADRAGRHGESALGPESGAAD